MNIIHVPARLPVWPDAVRGGSNALLRSAMFAGIHSSRRQVLGIIGGPDTVPEGVTLASQDGITVKYAGLQLNQYDSDVFFEVLHRARRQDLGSDVKFAGAEFLASIGRTRSKETYKDLDNSLRRLLRGIVDLHWSVGPKRYVFTGTMIGSYLRETESLLYKVNLRPEIRTLFAPASWTQVEWAERKKLMNKPLSQWLHSYFSTHAQPFPVSVAYLKEKTGSPTKLDKHFKVELRQALKHLESLLGWVVAWEGDNVVVKRPPTDSQEVHLARAKAAAQQQKLFPLK